LKVDDNISFTNAEEVIRIVRDELQIYPYISLTGIATLNQCQLTNSQFRRVPMMYGAFAIIPKCRYAGGPSYVLRSDALRLLEAENFKMTMFEDVNVGYALGRHAIYPVPSQIIERRLVVDTEPTRRDGIIEIPFGGDNYVEYLYKSLSISTCTAVLKGGLGNQLFILLTALAYSAKHGKQLKVIRPTTATRPHYFDTILSRFTHLISGPIDEGTIVYNEPYFEYVEIPNIEGNVLLNGYFQSMKYFNDINHIIPYCLEFPMIPSITNITNLISALNAEGKTPVILHVRRGDYLLPAHRDTHVAQALSYYRSAISIIQEKVTRPHYLLISDDVPFLDTIPLAPTDKTICDYNEIETMYLMSLCKHFIIANSSFSWWGSYLGRAVLVIAPREWFGSAGPKSWQSIYNSDWIIT
jgi:hypothetical protein